MKDTNIHIHQIQDITFEYNCGDTVAIVELLIPDEDFVKALYHRKIKDIKFLYQEEENWQEKEKKKRIKDIKNDIKKLQKELNNLESEVK